MPIQERFGVPFFAETARRVMKHIYAPRPELKKRSIDKNKILWNCPAQVRQTLTRKASGRYFWKSCKAYPPGMIAKNRAMRCKNPCKALRRALYSRRQIILNRPATSKRARFSLCDVAILKVCKSPRRFVPPGVN